MSKPHRAKQPAQRIPTTEKLAQALKKAGAPAAMIAFAREGKYDDYKSDLANPIMQLVTEARAAGLDDIADRAIGGEFDGQTWEADEWAKSPEGRATFKQFGL